MVMASISNQEKALVKKGPWSTEEDRKLIAYIQRYGIWNWSHMAKPAGLTRSGKSCRLRWMNYLRPGIKRGHFSNEEEDTIMKLHAEMGNRWSAIAAKLPGRTDNEVKNHWHANLKKRLETSLTHTSFQVGKLDEPSSELSLSLSIVQADQSNIAY